jgi:hypothetical protein
MWPAWTNMLSAWQWALLLAVPPAIIALYFLRLKRQPLEVPSTFLWLKSIEDLHVNSLWQRLRQSILLLLQLLLIGLVMVALLRPNWRGSALSGGRYIFLVDTSASMAARDVKPTRLHAAKRQVESLIDRMNAGDKAMIISFSDRAKVEQPYTDNRKELRRRLSEINQTQRPTSLTEAIHVASGLANPGRSATDIRDEQVAEALPAQVFIVSDGKFADVENFNLGNLQAVFLPIGQPNAENLAIAAFSTRASDRRPDQLQAFARIESFAATDREVNLELYRDGNLLDASAARVPAGKSASVAFDLENVTTGILELRAATGDELPLDDVAWAAINPPRRARVLMVMRTPNEPLTFALSTESARKLADVTIKGSDYLATEDYQAHAAAGDFDLVIYDRCRPQRMPQANTFFIGSLPPDPTPWKAHPKVDVPQIIDTDRSHPLMQFVELGDVIVSEGTPLAPPAGGTVLIHGGAGPLLVIAPRQAFEDAVLGFEIYGDRDIHTNWPVRLSFPVFILNLLEYLGGQGQRRLHQPNLAPGQQAVLRLDTTAGKLQFETPAHELVSVRRDSAGTFNFTATDLLGPYRVREAGTVDYRFTVNLFDPAESDIRPRPNNSVKIGPVEVVGNRQVETTRREAWKWIVLAALVVLLAEWYIYNRRVYL